MDDLSSVDPVDNYNHISDELIYTAVNIPGNGSSSNDFECQFSGCVCENNSCSVPSCVCVSQFGPNYSDDLLLLSEKFGNASVIECNDVCKCDSSCRNRVAQKGPRDFLEIFDCGNMKGLGLRTNRSIPKGAFVCEYAGEVIGKTEAKRRYEVASAKGDMNYIFVLRESTCTDVMETIVDPTMIGNIGRYINHCCNPNCAIVPVRVNCAVPKLAIFTVRDLFAGEEITFDYSGGRASNGNPQVDNRKECFCGSEKCLKFLPFDEFLS